jgi:hypothetical protein
MKDAITAKMNERFSGLEITGFEYLKYKGGIY